MKQFKSAENYLTLAKAKNLNEEELLYYVMTNEITYFIVYFPK